MQTRVLMVHPSGVSGIWHYANSLSRALIGIGLEVALVAQLPYEDLGELAGAPVYTIGPRMSTFRTAIRQASHRVVNHTEKMARFGALVAGYRPSIVHFHAPMGGFDWVYFRAIRSLGAKIIYTAHDARPLNGEATWFDRARYRAADHVFVHSKSCANLLAVTGINPGKVSIIPHGSYSHFCLNADLSKASARQSLGLQDESSVVLFFGAISPYKGLDTLISAFRAIVLQKPTTRLVIAGHPLMNLRPFLDQIEALGLRDRVLLDIRYIPFEEFAKHFRSADVVVLPYHRISQSGVLQLAYGFGRPVVVTDAGGLGEAVGEDGTGIITPVGDVGRLAGAILEVLSNRTRAEEMGRRAQVVSETKYSWQMIGESTARVYRSVREK